MPTVDFEYTIKKDPEDSWATLKLVVNDLYVAYSTDPDMSNLNKDENDILEQIVVTGTKNLELG